MTITTTMAVDDKTITQYLGIVSGCVIMSISGGSKMVQAGWNTGVKNASAAMESQATQLGADAIIGVTLNAYKSGMADYMYISGTAVKLV